MKKVAVLAFWNKYGGGVYQYTQSLVDALKEDKTNQYILFCFDQDSRFDNYGLEVRKIKEFSNPGLKKAVRLFQLLFYVRKPWFISDDVKTKFQDIDLIISPCISEFPHFYLNKQFVFTLHDMQEKYYPHFFSRYIRFTRWLYNRTLTKTAEHIICESNFVKADIEKYTKTPASKISVIPSPPPQDLIEFHYSESEHQKILAKYQLPAKYIFYPAQCWEHKNHIRLVEAFNLVLKNYPDVQLILTGSQNDNYPALVKKINELQLGQNVRHLGYIDYEDFPYLYKASLFLVMPTLFESVSIPIYEAFALETAVCSSNVVGLPEQIGDAGLIFDPTDISDMAEKISLLTGNEKLRKELAKMGLERVKNFNHQIYRQKLITAIFNN